MSGKVYIVGAGPGNFELLTLKAYRILNEADVILYDRLVGEEIEEFLRSLKGKEVIYVGKERGERGEKRQQEINRLMKKYATEGKVVVRLKGGDPGVFGRLAEEMEFLFNNNIPFEVVPGVSSVNAAPVSSNIPLTHPEAGFGFLVVSGRDTVRLNELIGSGTMIVLMGGCTAKEVALNLIKSGINPETEVAVIERGSFKDQRVTFSTVKSLTEVEFDFKSPALIVIGDIVKLAKKYSRLIGLDKIRDRKI
ncbi:MULTISPECIES: uroporphyrinogen-III C-methyltransferase [unclassified Archaeoglobus]|uniref:uroporphyrinogen-III C-methyltransferase n=1 Tax=unclassified Archaeoglobus TaxID=2643606 RepID=UPI0025BFF5FB|nr:MULTISPECIES: uroporphyrinogen-III C-methyltransferase [unclassified Archaeoglobus]